MELPSPAEQRQSYQLPPGKYDQAIQFNRQVNTLHFVSVAWTLMVLALMLRFQAKRWKRAAGRRFFGRELLAVAAMLAIPWIADLPFDAYRHWLATHYGLSIEGWTDWLVDWLKAGLLSGAAATGIVVVALAMARRSPRAWWVPAWFVIVAFIVGSTYLLPVVVEPLFYEFKVRVFSLAFISKMRSGGTGSPAYAATCANGSISSGCNDASGLNS